MTRSVQQLLGQFDGVSNAVLIVAGIAVAIGVLLAFAWMLRDQRPRYVLTRQLLSENELDFARWLRAACPPDMVICPQVAISALVSVAGHVTDRTAARNSYSQHYADFVICRAETYEILGVIELDDRSHRVDRRRKRDEKLDAIYATVGLPIVHVPARRTGRYNRQDAEKAFDMMRSQSTT